MEPSPYLFSFEILSNDFKKMLEYVEPVKENNQTYSHRLYELYLRACTDFESACKEKLISNDYDKEPNDMKIYDYNSLESSLLLSSVFVGVLIWRPSRIYVSPFNNWSEINQPLDWYQNYNRVKHNRNEQFSLANLQNVTLALSGLFALLVRLDVIPTGPGYTTRPFDSQHVEHIYPGYIFSACLPL